MDAPAGKSAGISRTSQIGYCQNGQTMHIRESARHKPDNETISASDRSRTQCAKLPSRPTAFLAKDSQDAASGTQNRQHRMPQNRRGGGFWYWRPYDLPPLPAAMMPTMTAISVTRSPAKTASSTKERRNMATLSTARRLVVQDLTSVKRESHANRSKELENARRGLEELPILTP